MKHMWIGVGVVALLCGTPQLMGCSSEADSGSSGADASSTQEVTGSSDAPDAAPGDVADPPLDTVEQDTALADDDTVEPADVGPVDATEPDTLGDTDGPDPDDATDAEDAVVVIGCEEPCPLSSTCENGQCIKLPQACPGGCLDGQYCNEQGNCTVSECVLPSSFSPIVQKTDSLVLPDGEHGCDLTGDGDVDNKLGVVLKLMGNANAEIAQRIALGTFTWLFEAPDWNTDGVPFIVNALPGELVEADCSPTAPDANCNYAAWESGYSWGEGDTCPAAFHLEVSVVDGQLHNVGEDQITITLPFIAGQPLSFDVMKVSLQADVTGDDTWESTSMALLCGAVPGPTLHTIIDQMPQELFDDVGLTKQQGKDLVDGALDVDVNNDGFPDSLSAATEMSTIPGAIIGIY